MGSGSSSEVDSALEVMILLASKYARELLPLSSHISGMLSTLFLCSGPLYWIAKFKVLPICFSFCSGILDYLEGFNVQSLHKAIVSTLYYC